METQARHICTQFPGMLLTQLCTWCLALGNGVATKLGRPLDNLKNAEAVALVSQTKKLL